MIESGLVSRRLGWYKLSFQTLGADPKEGGVQVAAPFARMEELLPILAEAGFPPPPPRAASPRATPRALPLGRALAAARPAVAGSAHALRTAGRNRGGCCCRSALFAALRWRKHAYALGRSRPVCVQRTAEAPVWIIPFEKAQTISVGAARSSAGCGSPACWSTPPARRRSVPRRLSISTPPTPIRWPTGCSASSTRRGHDAGDCN